MGGSELEANPVMRYVIEHCGLIGFAFVKLFLLSLWLHIANNANIWIHIVLNLIMVYVVTLGTLMIQLLLTYA